MNIKDETIKKSKISLDLNDEKHDDTRFAIRKVQIGNMSDGRGFINIYDRGHLSKHQATSEKIRTQLKDHIEEKFKNMQYQEDHRDGSQNEFHPNGEPGNYENHYHIRANNVITSFDINRLLSFLGEIKAINKDFSAEISKKFSNENQTITFLAENSISIKKEEKKEEQEDWDFFSTITCDEESDTTEESTQSYGLNK